MGTYHSHVYPTPQGEFMAMVWADMDGMQYPVCECYRKSDAALIADALNAYAAQQEQAEQVKALVEALRPVAAIADAYPASYPDRAVAWEFVTAGGERLRLTLGDARKAAAALRAVEGEEATP